MNLKLTALKSCFLEVATKKFAEAARDGRRWNNSPDAWVNGGFANRWYNQLFTQIEQALDSPKEISEDWLKQAFFNASQAEYEAKGFKFGEDLIWDILSALRLKRIASA